SSAKSRFRGRIPERLGRVVLPRDARFAFTLPCLAKFLQLGDDPRRSFVGRAPVAHDFDYLRELRHVPERFARLRLHLARVDVRELGFDYRGRISSGGYPDVFPARHRRVVALHAPLAHRLPGPTPAQALALLQRAREIARVQEEAREARVGVRLVPRDKVAEVEIRLAAGMDEIREDADGCALALRAVRKRDIA